MEVAAGRSANVDETAERTAALVRLTEEHLDAAYRLARAILREPNDAQDATHDALLQASRKWRVR
jgi:DNA-directed RNA polymerase specialized sigma24 family protein